MNYKQLSKAIEVISRNLLHCYRLSSNRGGFCVCIYIYNRASYKQFTVGSVAGCVL